MKPIFKLKLQLLLILASLLSLTSCESITVQNANTCSASGLVSYGGICSQLLSSATTTLSFNEYLDFLQAQPMARTCVPVPGFQVCSDNQTTGTPITLPARAAAIAMSAIDWGAFANELDIACRDLGSKCTFAAVVANMKLAQPKLAIASTSPQTK